MAMTAVAVSADALFEVTGLSGSDPAKASNGFYMRSNNNYNGKPEYAKVGDERRRVFWDNSGKSWNIVLHVGVGQVRGVYGRLDHHFSACKSTCDEPPTSGWTHGASMSYIDHHEPSPSTPAQSVTLPILRNRTLLSICNVTIDLANNNNDTDDTWVRPITAPLDSILASDSITSTTRVSSSGNVNAQTLCNQDASSSCDSTVDPTVGGVIDISTNETTWVRQPTTVPHDSILAHVFGGHGATTIQTNSLPIVPSDNEQRAALQVFDELVLSHAQLSEETIRTVEKDVATMAAPLRQLEQLVSDADSDILERSDDLDQLLCDLCIISKTTEDDDGNSDDGNSIDSDSDAGYSTPPISAPPPISAAALNADVVQRRERSRLRHLREQYGADLCSGNSSIGDIIAKLNELKILEAALCRDVYRSKLHGAIAWAKVKHFVTLLKERLGLLLITFKAISAGTVSRKAVLGEEVLDTVLGLAVSILPGGEMLPTAAREVADICQNEKVRQQAEAVAALCTNNGLMDMGLLCEAISIEVGVRLALHCLNLDIESLSPFAELCASTILRGAIEQKLCECLPVHNIGSSGCGHGVAMMAGAMARLLPVKAGTLKPPSFKHHTSLTVELRAKPAGSKDGGEKKNRAVCGWDYLCREQAADVPEAKEIPRVERLLHRGRELLGGPVDEGITL